MRLLAILRDTLKTKQAIPKVGASVPACPQDQKASVQAHGQAGTLAPTACYIFRAFGLFCLLSASLALGQDSENQITPKSYLSEQQVVLSYKTIVEDEDGFEFKFDALVGGDVSIVMLGLRNFTLRSNPGRASAVLQRKNVDARIEFWAHLSAMTEEEFTLETVAQHFAFIQERIQQNTDFKVVLEPDPANRPGMRFFKRRPFELAYSFSSFDAAGNPTRTVVHENWTIRKGHFLASRLICPEPNYNGMLKEARDIWRSATFNEY